MTNLHNLDELIESQFEERFPLRRNHLNPSGWTIDGVGYLFETYGEDLAFVRRQHPQYVWTLREDDGGSLVLLSGFHIVNRVGYLVSTAPTPEGTNYLVRIDPEIELTPAPEN